MFTQDGLFSAESSAINEGPAHPTAFLRRTQFPSHGLGWPVWNGFQAPSNSATRWERLPGQIYPEISSLTNMYLMGFEPTTMWLERSGSNHLATRPWCVWLTGSSFVTNGTLQNLEELSRIRRTKQITENIFSFQLHLFSSRLHLRLLQLCQLQQIQQLLLHS